MCLFEPLSPRKGAFASKESDSHRHRAMMLDMIFRTRSEEFEVRISKSETNSNFGFTKDRYLEIGIKYMTRWGIKELANRSDE